MSQVNQIGERWIILHCTFKSLLGPCYMNVFLLGGTPSLEVLWLSQEPAAQARRLDTLLACFNLSSLREDLQAVESPLRALCCLLIYIFVQVTLSPRFSYITNIQVVQLPHSLASPSWSAGSLSVGQFSWLLSTEHNWSFRILMERLSQQVSGGVCLFSGLAVLSEYCGRPRRIDKS